MTLGTSFRTLYCHWMPHKFRPWLLDHQFHLRLQLWGYQVRVLDLPMLLDWMQSRLGWSRYIRFDIRWRQDS